MSVPCEAVVKSVAPALRAVLAKKLLEEHGLRQKEAAKLLGITQAAISKYIRKVRGRALDLENIPEIQILTAKIANRLVSKEISRSQLVQALCEACNLVRKKGLVCPLCRRRDRSLKDCAICKTDC